MKTSRTAIATIICGIIGFISLIHTLITYNGITGMIAVLCFIEIYTYGIMLTKFPKDNTPTDVGENKQNGGN